MWTLQQIHRPFRALLKGRGRTEDLGRELVFCAKRVQNCVAFHVWSTVGPLTSFDAENHCPGLMSMAGINTQNKSKPRSRTKGLDKLCVVSD